MRPRRDSLFNLTTGMGDDSAQTLDTRQRTRRRLDTFRTTAHWNAEFLQSPWARREVAQLARDMVREGIRLDGLPERVDVAAVMADVDADLDYKPDGSIDRSAGLLWYLWRLVEQGDKVGGAAIMPIPDDGLDPIEPLDWRRIKRIVGWVVLDRSELTPFSYSGTSSEPEFFVLSDILAVPDHTTGKRGPSILNDGHRLQPGDIIHRSRVMLNRGIVLSHREMRRRQWWGASKLELNTTARFHLEYGDENLGTYLDRSTMLNYQVGGLDELRSRCDEQGVKVGEAELDRHFRDTTQRARATGVIVTDGGTPTVKDESIDGVITHPGRNADKIEAIVTPASGLVEINQYNRSQWQAGAGIPESIAFGQAPSGLRGGENEGDWQSWAGEVRARQQPWGTFVIKWMLSIIFASKDGPTNGVPVDPDSYTVWWNPLLVPTPMEEAQIAEVWADIDGKRQLQEAQRPDETRNHRVVDGQLTGPVPALEQVEGDQDLTTSLIGIATNATDIMTKVGAGELTPGAGAYLLQKQDPQRFADADEGVKLAAPEPPPEPVAGLDPVVDRFASMRGDLRSAKDIAVEMTRATGLTWTPNRVHVIAKKEGMEKAGFGRLRGYPMQFFRDLALNLDKGATLVSEELHMDAAEVLGVLDGWWGRVDAAADLGFLDGWMARVG